MDTDLANFAVYYLQKKGATYAEARMESREEQGFILKNSNPEIAGFDETTGLGIRFILNHTMGFATTNELAKDKIRDVIDRSLILANKAVPLSETISFSDAKAVNDTLKVKQKINLLNLDPSEKLKILQDLDKHVKSADTRYFSISDTLLKKYYINSDGIKLYSEIPRVKLFYFLSLTQGTNSIQRWLQKGAVSGYECLKTWNLEEELPQELKALEKNMNEGISAPKGITDVICSSEVTGIAVHESAGHPYEADRIAGREAAQAGESFIKPSMIGERIGSDVVTVVDDPTLEGSYGFYLYDDEGIKARRKTMIEKGMIKEFMHDRSTSSQMKTESNGAARACIYDVEPLVRMSNTFMLPGEHHEEELIRGVKKGIYLKSFMEWNIDDKRYNQKYVGCEAYLIENGEITRPVKAPALEITTPALYSSIDAVSNKIELFAGNCGKGEPMQGIPVLMGGPTIRLRKVSIS